MYTVNLRQDFKSEAGRCTILQMCFETTMLSSGKKINKRSWIHACTKINSKYGNDLNIRNIK